MENIKEFKIINTYNNSLYIFKTSKFSLHLEIKNSYTGNSQLLYFDYDKNNNTDVFNELIKVLNTNENGNFICDYNNSNMLTIFDRNKNSMIFREKLYLKALTF
ncbi:hypothetical protein [Fusobacterium phage Fnu1]|uniref:Uncharacterized protein n=1 Tax=Fusobacterium phage Fnu1 TaxID=2530024 RepID=A0A481W5N7_9CAUD|nr:hypothetical protein KMD24_gp048 [Fusobacterium phage Fnu1]QBJ04187.1 hypothetical protein [Fusobacterium phage Fnu1]